VADVVVRFPEWVDDGYGDGWEVERAVCVRDGAKVFDGTVGEAHAPCGATSGWVPGEAADPGTVEDAMWVFAAPFARRLRGSQVMIESRCDPIRWETRGGFSEYSPGLRERLVTVVGSPDFIVLDESEWAIFADRSTVVLAERACVLDVRTDIVSGRVSSTARAHVAGRLAWLTMDEAQALYSE